MQPQYDNQTLRIEIDRRLADAGPFCRNVPDLGVWTAEVIDLERQAALTGDHDLKADAAQLVAKAYRVQRHLDEAAEAQQGIEIWESTPRYETAWYVV